MTSRTKEEQRLLDEKIARIQKQNEEILRRQKEIEEDKRLAEQQNAVVKLRPSTTSASRERTPALKPSNRETKGSFADDFSEPSDEPVVHRHSRDSFRGRGGERRRDYGDSKASGPPPDPKSFLYDDERYTGTRFNDREERGDLRQQLNRRQGKEYEENRDRQIGARYSRDSQNMGRRDNIEPREGRGMRGGRVGSKRSEEDAAWKAERMRIDEARIQRQKSADGKWRREWDNEKIVQDDGPPEEARPLSRGSSQYDHEHSSNQYHCPKHSPTDNCPRRNNREGPSSAGKGRGRLSQAELLSCTKEFKFELLKQPSKEDNRSFAEHSQERQKIQEFSSPPSPQTRDQRDQQIKNLSSTSSSHDDDYQFDPRRQIKSVGNSFKISIPNNLRPSKSTSKPQRQANENRGRFRTQFSYSSQSDDDLPQNRNYKNGRRQRSQKNQKSQQDKSNSESKTPPRGKSSTENSPNVSTSAQTKPPLPPRVDQSPSSYKERKEVEEEGGDGSWEDMTTSGTESMGEDFSSKNSSFTKDYPNTMTVNRVIIEDQPALNKEIADEHLKSCGSVIPPFDKFLGEIGNVKSNEMGNSTIIEANGNDGALDGIIPLKELSQKESLETSGDVSLDCSNSLIHNDSSDGLLDTPSPIKQTSKTECDNINTDCNEVEISVEVAEHTNLIQALTQQEIVPATDDNNIKVKEENSLEELDLALNEFEGVASVEEKCVTVNKENGSEEKLAKEVNENEESSSKQSVDVEDSSQNNVSNSTPSESKDSKPVNETISEEHMKDTTVDEALDSQSIES